MRFDKHGRHWAVYDESNTLVCLTVYACGAREVVRRLSPGQDTQECEAHPHCKSSATAPKREKEKSHETIRCRYDYQRHRECREHH